MLYVVVCAPPSVYFVYLFAGLPHPLIDIYDTPVYKGNLERMQGFFCTLYDNW